MAFHQYAGAAAHDGLGDLPLAVLQASLGAYPQRTRRVAETHGFAFAAAGGKVYQSVPGTAAAVPIATAAVPIIAWCSLPMDRARTRRSISPAPTCLPLEAV